jgi:predicted branched-subunit amino acid permease
MALNGEFELSPGVVAGTLPARSARVRFVGGARLGIPVAIGYFLISLSFGALSPQTLSFPGAMLMSLLVFAGAAQFMAVGMLAAGASVLQIIIATLFVGLRGSVVSLAFSPRR